MSYCRFGWEGSDVYVYGSSSGIECCSCWLYGSWTGDTPEAMIAHLAVHKQAGHYVPPSAIARLWSEVEGPNEAVRPEPPEMAQARMWMKVVEEK